MCGLTAFGNILIADHLAPSVLYDMDFVALFEFDIAFHLIGLTCVA